MSRRGGKERFNLGTLQYAHRLEANEASLLTGPEQDLPGIGKTCAADEAQAYSVCCCGYRNKTVGWAFSGAVADYEEMYPILRGSAQILGQARRSAGVSLNSAIKPEASNCSRTE